MSSMEATMSMLEAMPEEARLKVLEFTKKLFTSERPANPYRELTSAQILGDLEESRKQIANWFISEVLRLLGESGGTLADCKLTPEALAELVTLLEGRVINGPTAKELLPELFEKGGMPKALVDARGLGQVSDAGALQAFVDQAVASNPKSVADFKAGKKAAAGFIVGQVMKLSGGKADPKLVGPLVAKRLAAT